MAALAIAAVGSGIGGAIGGSFLGVAASSWGYMIGSVIGSMLFGPEAQDTHGPRLKDSTYSGDVEGTDMPILFGGDRLPGKPIWIKNPPREVKTTEDSGGKGGGGASHTSYTYFQDLAVCFGEFNCQPPRRIWMNQEIVYDASGENNATKMPGLSFSWYSGDTGEIDALIEGYVGEGNSPAYNGRAVMVLTSLNLSEKFGNRIPLIEAELQTTGVASTSITNYNMGESDNGSVFIGLSIVRRHPTDDIFICTTLGNSNVGDALFYADMANQYVFKWIDQDTAIYPWIGLDFFTDPWPQNPTVPISVLAARTCIGGGCNTATLYRFEWPSGKHEATYTYTTFLGGASIACVSKFLIIIAQRNAGPTYTYIDKQTMQSITNRSVVTDTGITGLNADSFFQTGGGFECIDHALGLFGGCYVPAADNKGPRYYICSYNFGLTPTITGYTYPFETWGPLDPDNFAVASGRGSRPIYVAENDELWFPYTYNGTIYDTTSEFNVGIFVLKADDGELVEYIDLVREGYTAATSYWGILSGHPHLHYEPVERRIWFAFSGTGDLFSIHVDTRNIQKYSAAAPGGAWAVAYPNRNTAWGATEVADEFLISERTLNIQAKGTVSIGTVVASICARCGLAASEYDVTALNSKTVGSFVHATRHSGRQDIEVLLGIAQADAVQSDYKIKFVNRGGAVKETIPVDDVGAQEITGAPQAKDGVSMTLPMETEIPQVFEIQYRSSDNAYTQAIAQSFIATGANIAKKTAQLPLAITDQQAAEIVERYHQQLVDPRTVKVDLPIKYTYLEPTDPIEVPKAGKNYRVRITRMDRGANWIGRVDAILDSVEDQTSTAVAPGVDEFIGNISTAQAPQEIIVDGPLLRDSDQDHPGPYLTAYTYSDTAPAAVWHYSTDDQTFTELFVQSDQPAAGLAQSTANTSTWEEWDDVSILSFEVQNGASLSSSTKSAIEADPTINAFAYGRPGRWEYLNAATVTLVQSTPTKIYELTNLLRGRRGTDNHIGIHESRDYIIQIQTTAWNRHVLQNAQLDVVFHYRLPPDSVAVSDLSSESFTAVGQPLKPYSPINVEGTPHTTTVWAASTAYALNDEVVPTVGNSRRYVCTTAGTSGGTEPTWNTTIDGTQADNTVTWTVKHELDFDMAWTRRTRRGGSLGGDFTLTDGVGGPLSEDSEEYEIDMVNSATQAVISTKTGLTSTDYEYLGVDQETDGTDSLGLFYMDVYQKSAVVGRGFRGRGTYDRQWGHVLNTGLSLGAKILFPLDDAAGSNAKDWVTLTNKGTFTSGATTDGTTSDNRRAMLADGTGYMKCGTNLRDLITGKTAATVVFFRHIGGFVSNEQRVSMTKGGSSDRCHFYDGGGYQRVWWGASSGSGVLGLNGNADSNTNNSRVIMVASTCVLSGSSIALTLSMNGKNQTTTSGGTGHSAYASTFQDQTRNASYNDTIHGSTAAVPTAIPNTSGCGTMYVMVFDRALSLTEQRNLFLSAFTRYLNYIDDLGSLIYHCELDESGTTQTPRVGTTNFTVGSGWSTQFPGIMTGAEHGVYNFSETTSRVIYQALTSTFKLQTFSVAFWWSTKTQLLASHGPTTNVRVFSMSPRDWNNASVKKGVHIHYDTTNGLQCDIGTGGASMSNISSGSANITGGNTYHICLTVDATNGVTLYVNGSSVGTPLSALTIDWVDGTANGPNPGQMYIGGDNTNASITSTNFTGCRGMMGNFEFYDEELSATEVLALYNIGMGKA